MYWDPLHTVACVCFLLTTASLPGGVTRICSRSLPVYGSVVVSIARVTVLSSSLNYVLIILKTIQSLNTVTALNNKFTDSYAAWMPVFLGHWSHEEMSR